MVAVAVCPTRGAAWALDAGMVSLGSTGQETEVTVAQRLYSGAPWKLSSCLSLGLIFVANKLMESHWDDWLVLIGNDNLSCSKHILNKRLLVLLFFMTLDLPTLPTVTAQ